MQNIGVAFVKMSQFTDAVTSFEHIMAEKASFQTGMQSRKAFYYYSSNWLHTFFLWLEQLNLFNLCAALQLFLNVLSLRVQLAFVLLCFGRQRENEEDISKIVNC